MAAGDRAPGYIASSRLGWDSRTERVRWVGLEGWDWHLGIGLLWNPY